MRICIDLDGVVCELRRPGQQYADLNPIAGAVEKLRALRSAGHYIILYTARHMKTCDGNVGKVIARQGKVTMDWLQRLDVPYDELHFGKPHADIYLDDNAVRFESWDHILGDGSNLPSSKESSINAEGERGPH
ncbi:MAG: capsular biosynthesis protein [Tepidisphaeraceae bacterium]|jgi:capsule biosynthesis phosphatase